MSYKWEGRPDQIENYPYVKDEKDIAAYNLYSQRGFVPPQRPDGFLDDAEKASWEKWRAKVTMNG